MEISRDRVLDWAGVVVAIINKVRNYPLKIGQHDCIILASLVECSISNSPRLSKVFSQRGKYHDDESGVEVFGFDNPWDLMDAYLPKNDVKFTQPGDIVGLQNPNSQKILGIALDTRIAVVSEEGLAFTKIVHAKRSWAV